MTAAIPYPISIPLGAATMIKVIHVVLLSYGANASTHTGKNMAKITAETPVRNLAAASSYQPVENVNAKRAKLY